MVLTVETPPSFGGCSPASTGREGRAPSTVGRPAGSKPPGRRRSPSRSGPAGTGRGLGCGERTRSRHPPKILREADGRKVQTFVGPDTGHHFPTDRGFPPGSASRNLERGRGAVSNVAPPSSADP